MITYIDTQGWSLYTGADREGIFAGSGLENTDRTEKRCLAHDAAGFWEYNIIYRIFIEEDGE